MENKLTSRDWMPDFREGAKIPFPEAPTVDGVKRPLSFSTGYGGYENMMRTLSEKYGIHINELEPFLIEKGILKITHPAKNQTCYTFTTW